MHHIKLTTADGTHRHYTYSSEDIGWVFVVIKNLKSRGVQFTHYFEE